jgi:hypothetical protein
MLVEGTSAPEAYKSCDLQRFVVEGQFTRDDNVQINCVKQPDGTYQLDPGKINGQLWWKHRTLYGKDYDWNFALDYTGYKVAFAIFPAGYSKLDRDFVGVKYDGKVTVSNANYATANDIIVPDNNPSNNAVYVKVPDTDTGWAESINPSNDEVKAFMNGWKATENNGTRYTAWASVVDASAPVVQTIDFVKANIAPGYDGYRLHYKLVNPEPITDVNIRIQGELWNIVPGDNYITVDTGIVLGEVANPALTGGNYQINSINYPPDSPLQFRSENIKAVYRNQIYDPSPWVHVGAGANTFGNDKVYLVPAAFDVNAIYTTDYQILKTLHAQSFGSLTLKYAQDVFTAVTRLALALEGKQQRDSALDTLVDLSMYEEIPLLYTIVRCNQQNTNDLRAYQYFKLIPKKAVPIATISIAQASYWDGAGGVVSIPVSDVMVSFATLTKDMGTIKFQYIGSNSTIKTALLNYGITLALKLKFDCRGRV